MSWVERSAVISETSIPEAKSLVGCVRDQGNKDLDFFQQEVVETFLLLEGSISSCVRNIQKVGEQADLDCGECGKTERTKPLPRCHARNGSPWRLSRLRVKFHFQELFVLS